ncbi:hypothetical protein ACTHR6_17360 [Ralstonia holmesii]|uniref:Uncharacterized protein n=1 Tax=Ralstonia holmesii TaxID=3058602 RepID=A0ABC8Q5U3_9RALS|nr:MULTISPECIES: hypothetical protein [Ralstonia]CAJ0683710.1 hypothetical protein R11007_00165 [Ralstonia sp. LMG 32967]CAJ0774033.1 hypothetical protein LMG18096_00103 [Ralstonia sp. LMG 32967]CAJ0819608.1 hypothetical protein LMG18093_04088 [Ralstonia sp. LMG 32967]
MKTASQNHDHLTAKEIREVIGPFEMEVLTRILAIEPSIQDVQLAYKWLRSDEHLIRGMDIELTGKAKMIYELLDAEFPDFDASGRGV